MPSSQATKTARSAASPSTVTWEREVARFIDAAGNTTHSFGLGKLIGRLFALLYLSPEPLCLDDIAQKLKISKASASITVRQLASWQAVSKASGPVDQGRRDFYQAELRFGVILKNGLLPGLRKKLASAGVQIDRTLEAAPGKIQEDRVLPSDPGSRSHEICRRLRLARGLHQKVNALLSSPLLDHLV